MRMWLVDPKLMCRQHLLGEHVEIHMFVGFVKKGKSIKGFIDKGLLEPSMITKRHDDLVHEMLKRGYNHKSPLIVPDEFYKMDDFLCENIVDVDESLNELFMRCDECRKRMVNNYTTSITAG